MKRLVLFSLILIIAPACAKKDKPKGPTPQVVQAPPPQPPTPPAEPAAPPAPSLPAEPESEPFRGSYPGEIRVTLLEKGGPIFGEPATVLFTRYGNITSRHLYVFNKSYIGPVDNRSIWWWSQGDDILWNTPYSVISVDLKQMRIFGGSEPGSGDVLGKIDYKENKFSMTIRVQLDFDKDAQTISIVERGTPPIPRNECAPAARLVNLCELYNAIAGAVRAIDFQSLGEAGPDVAKRVASVNTLISLAKSAWTFEATVDQVRDKYLIPMLKAIGQIKALRKVDPRNRPLYLDKTKDAYTNLIVTSLDTTIKTQKIMPEALTGAGATALGIYLANLGFNNAADRLISGKQPPWFKELITPIIREFGIVLVDLLSNTSKPMEYRVSRLLAMENQIKNAVRRLCNSSPTASRSECSSALNQ